MTTELEIADAIRADAGIVSRILTRSIQIGCSQDHRNDPARVRAWTRNKNAEQVALWLADQRLQLSLVRVRGKPVGVGMVRDDGRIILCYVQPEWFRRGIGRALMTHLEAWLRERGYLEARLNSNCTGLSFFQHLGYRASARSFNVAGLSALPMQKTLI